MRATILIQARKGTSGGVREAMRKRNEVVAAYEVFGRFDVAANARVAGAAGLRELLGQIKRIDGVVVAESLLEPEG